MMDERLADLYQIPEHVLPQDIYLQDLSEQCSRLEEQVRAIVSRLPRKQQQIMEAYLDIRDELEFQSVKVAMRFGKYLK